MTNLERATQVWQILIAASDQRRTLTYKIVADRIGVPSIAMANILGTIMRYCDANGLPPLTVLVVQSDSGRPGDGLTTAPDPDRAREQVFSHDWFAMRPVSPADFAAH